MDDGRGATPMERRLALAAGCALDTDARGIIAAAASGGFEYVGLRVTGEHAVPTPREVEAIASFARSVGVSIHDVEVYRVGHADVALKPLLDTAAALGATGVLVVSDLADDADTIREIDRIARHCDQRDLVLGLEYMAWTNPASPGAALAMAQRTGCRIIVDVLHHVRVGAGTPELAALVDADALAWVQVCDGPLTSDTDLLHEARHARLPPGEGELPLADLLALVPSSTLVSVEVQSDVLAAACDPGERARRLFTATEALVNHRA